jgi:hypothetical protein
VVGEYAPGAQIEDHDDTFMPRFLFAFWRLCQQRIATAEVTTASCVLRCFALPESHSW